MENYTIDLARLGRKEVAWPLGTLQVSEHQDDGKKEGGSEHEDLVNYDDDGGDEESLGDVLGDFTLDLGGLGEKPSSVMVEDAIQQRDEVPSDDDGPEDFTMNLEKWMRNTEKWKKQLADDASPEEEGVQEDAEEIVQNSGDKPMPTKGTALEQQETSTPAPLQDNAKALESVVVDERLQPPPLSRLNTEILQDRAAEEVFDRISALQAEVERMRIEEEDRRWSYNGLEQENERLSQECQDIKLKLLTAEQETSADKSRVATLQTNFESAIQEMASVKAQAEVDKRESNTKIATLESDLRLSQEESKRHQAEIEVNEEEANSNVQELNAKLETAHSALMSERDVIKALNERVAMLVESNEVTSRIAHSSTANAKAIENELHHAQEQLTETRRILESVEEENDRLVQQNDRQAQDILGLESLISDKTAEARSNDGVIEELRIALCESQKDAAARATSHASHEGIMEALRKEHQTAVSSSESSHAKELEKFRSAILKAGQGMQKQEARLRKEHKNEVDSLKTQITALEKEQAKPAEAIDSDIENELRSAIRVLNNKLERANASLSAARSEAEIVTKRAEEAQRTNDVVNAGLEERFADIIEAREREWRRRVAVLFREREKMGKALMLGWGREEVGIQESMRPEQGYRYRFVTR